MTQPIYEQMDLFSEVLPRKQITKPIRLIELFAGIGAQFKALKELTKNVESYKICEWHYQSTAAYNAIHIKDYNDYSSNMSKDELIEKLQGISIDSQHNHSATKEQLNKKSIDWLRSVYNNCVATHNLINIMDVHGDDLEIVDTDKYEYIMTYSFPCQDLSLAGKRKGMDKSQAEGGTRSGLLWEVERILDELERESLPQILLCENVPEIVGVKNINNFKKWEQKLRELGYTNYVKILNAKDYYTPQTRRRCFVVSILGDYAYDWPIRMTPQHYLLDKLEPEVDDKYFLSQKMVNYLTKEDTGKYNHKEVFMRNFNPNKKFASTICTEPGQKPVDNFIIVPEKTKKGYAIAHEGDGVYIDRPEQKRGVVQKGMIQTIKTTNNDVGVVVIKNEKYCVRKLTPLETFRLMGFQDIDYQACVDIGQSNAAMFHEAGDSIVVTVLIALFAPMFSDPSNHREIIKNYIQNIIYKGEEK